MFTVPVPPVCIRPTVSMGDKGTREDDLTVAVGESLGLFSRGVHGESGLGMDRWCGLGSC